MKLFVVHISDAKGIDERSTIEVADGMDVGRAAQLALDAVVEQHGGQLTFPIFVDIHPAAQFASMEWMHSKDQPREAVRS